MRLFDMSESMLDMAVESHYNNMYNAYYHLDEPEPCCKVCYHQYGGFCMFQNREKEVEDDGYCDYFKFKEED